MAGSSFASTDSSKTLSITNSAGPAALTSILTHAPHEFLQPSGNTIQDAALSLVKRYFDPLLKGGNGSSGLEMVYLEGFDVEQVWEQVRGVVERLALKSEMEVLEEEGEGSSEEEEEEEEDVSMMEDDEEESSEEEEGDFEGFTEEMEEEERSEEEEGSEDGGVTLEDGSAAEEEVDDLEVDGSEDGEEEEDPEEDPEVKDLVVDVHGLNDGFFSIDDFNRQTELLELQDSQGGPIDSDDENDIDLDADPATIKENGEESDEDDADEEDMDLDQGVDNGENANDIKYDDFFAPPAQKRTGKPKAKVSWRDDVRKMYPEAEYEAVSSDMDRVRRDLFDDEDAPSDDEDVDMDGDPADPMNRRSSHQKRQAALMEQIRELENENVAKKQWVMTGEAKARDRPLNSLLEQDLDFERSGKPVPVITQEVTEGLEDMIKRRILDAEFDEVIKRRPGDITEKFRRGRVEVDDSKPQESLAEVYAKEHLKSTNPEDNPEAADEKLDKEHREIESIWTDVTRKLDALTSWHFTPKPAKPTLAIISDAPAISMEEAQPSAAAGGMAAHVSMLAPQEIYKPGKDKASMPTGEGSGREIIGKSGAAVSTREMTSDEKKRRRRREKEKIRKRNAGEGITRGEVKAGSKKDVIDTLKRGNVAIIGQGGEKRDVSGKMITEKHSGTSASFLKL